MVEKKKPQKRQNWRERERELTFFVMNNLEGIWERGENEVKEKSSWKMKSKSRWKVQKILTVEFMKMKGKKGGSRWKVQKSEIV